MAAPFITTPSPAPATAVAKDGAITVRVYENGTALVRTILALVFAGMALTEIAWDGAAFTPRYQRYSTRTAVVDGTYGNGHEYVFRRDPVWPDAPAFRAWAINSAGQETTSVLAPWVVDAPAPTALPPVVPVFPAGGGAGPTDSDAVAFDQAHFLGVIESIVAPEWLRPLRNHSGDGSGYELLQASAKVGERVSLAIQRLERDAFELFAPGPAKARGTVEFLRETDTAGALRVLAGTLVKTSRHGRTFVTLQDAVFGASDLGPVGVDAEATDYGYQYNVTGRVVTPSGEVLPGEIDTIDTMFQADSAGVADFIDPSITVQQVVNFDGGCDPALDGLGQDRGIVRGVGEPDETYRSRVMNLPDGVTPAAIRRALDRLAAAWGVAYQLVEVGDEDYQTAYDYPSQNAGTPTYLSPYPSELVAHDNRFSYDDPEPIEVGSYADLWFDDVEARGAFFVAISFPAPIADEGMAYDGTDEAPAESETLNGTTPGFFSISAYDLPADLPPEAGRAGAYDIGDPGLQGFLQAWWDTLNAIKAGGIIVGLALVPPATP